MVNGGIRIKPYWLKFDFQKKNVSVSIQIGLKFMYFQLIYTCGGGIGTLLT